MSHKKMNQNFYLLGESCGTIITLPFFRAKRVAEFLTIKFPGGEAVAIFLSRLDAEICRQYMNLQSDNGKKNAFELIVHQDERVQVFKKMGNQAYHLVCGFISDAKNKKLVIQGGCYSFMHFGLYPDDNEWLLWGGRKPTRDILKSVQETFSKVGELGYINELKTLDELDAQSLAQLARDAILKIGTSIQKQNGVIPVVFSPRRRKWVKLNFGGSNGNR